jgi:lipoyl(octanoyl) transferase
VIHRHLGAATYADALAEQHRLFDLRLVGEGEDTLLTLEHDPGVLTGGRRARDEHLVSDPITLAEAGVQRLRVDRGGDWTWHGPGQLVAYPIVRLKGLGLDVPAFVAGLEAAMAAVANAATRGVDVGVFGRRCGYPGLWVERHDGLAKLGAVGVHVRRFVTLHGLALNLDPDPWGFEHIVPCGLAEPVTSLVRLVEEAGGDPSQVPDVAQAAYQLADILPAGWRGTLDPVPTLA